MSNGNRATRAFALGLAAASLAAAAPAAAIDVLTGLVPADFANDRLLAAEARAFAPQRATTLVPVTANEEANPLGRTQAATTLAEMGVGSGATELVVSGVAGEPLLASATPEERRALGTLAALGGVLDGATRGGSDGADLGAVLDDLDDVLGGEGAIEELLDDLLGEDGVVPDLLDGDGGLLDVPTEDLQDILDDLPVDLPIRLPGLLR